MDNEKNIAPDIKPGPIAWMAGNSVASNLLMLVLLIGGIIWGNMIKQEVFPEFELDIVTVSVAYPGASPEEVEQGIILVIEEAVQGIEGIKEVSSYANEGYGNVVVEAMTGVNLQKLADDIQKEVDRISSFPEDAEDPTINIAIRRREVISLILYGDQDEHVLRELAENARDSLLQNKNITQVELDEAKNFEISIEISQETLRSLNITLDDIARRIKSASVELPGGGIKTSSGEVLVRMKERRNYGHEFGQIPIITQKDGTQVLLEDIALITDGFEDIDDYAEYNGHHAIMLDVYRAGEQTPIEVADAVNNFVSRLRDSLPPGVYVDTHNDRSEYYRQRLGLLVRNGWMGLGLVFIMLGLFLETRLAFWVAMGIPISFLGSLLFLPTIGISINMISMFAFIVALGIVVDDAIVVGENIHTMQQKGVPFLKAAVLGAREVAMPVTFSILTNIVAFMPLYFVPGIMGKIFTTIPAVVITVFIISLVESVFVLPAHLGHLKKISTSGPMAWINKYQQKFSNGFSNMVKKFYAPFLDIVLYNRYLILAIGIAVLLLTLAVIKSGRMGMTLFPRIESDYARVSITLPYGTPIEKTEAAQKIIVDAAKELAKETGGSRQVKGIFSRIGGYSGSHTADILVYLSSPDIRLMSTGEFTKRFREKVGPIPGLENISFKSDSGGPGSGAALTIELSHQSINVLEAASTELAQALSCFPKVRDIDDGFSPGKQQIDFSIKPEGRALGLTAQIVATQVRHSFYGTEVLRQQRGRNEIRVMVRLPESERVSEYNLEELIIRTPSGAEVPLRQVVNVKRGRAYTNITRRGGRRVVTVSADVVPPDQANQILDSIKADTLPKLTKKYSGLRYSFEGKQADMRESMKSLFTGLGLAMLVIFGLLAIPFRSYTQPVIVMVSIPFGIVGAVIGHMLMGYSLSIMSMFGVVALSGVVVNDSLVLIDFANRMKKAGMNHHDAIHAAGIQRFRPILLTTLTTFGGLTPMIFETSRQARYLIPMAISLGYGVLFATLITLILVPCLYIILEDFHKIRLWIWPETETVHTSLHT